jgi:hypothetical protein
LWLASWILVALRRFCCAWWQLHDAFLQMGDQHVLALGLVNPGADLLIFLGDFPALRFDGPAQESDLVLQASHELLIDRDLRLVN